MEDYGFSSMLIPLLVLILLVPGFLLSLALIAGLSVFLGRERGEGKVGAEAKEEETTGEEPIQNSSGETSEETPLQSATSTEKQL